jgi:hypothetical protein
MNRHIDADLWQLYELLNARLQTLSKNQWALILQPRYGLHERFPEASWAVSKGGLIEFSSKSLLSALLWLKAEHDIDLLVSLFDCPGSTPSEEVNHLRRRGVIAIPEALVSVDRFFWECQVRRELKQKRSKGGAA